MKFDTYTRRARLYPALLVALPLGLATLAWFPEGLAGWGTLWGLVTWSGATALLAQVGRDKGRVKEPGLFEQWGGKPTTRMLRHRHARFFTELGALDRRKTLINYRVSDQKYRQHNCSHSGRTSSGKHEPRRRKTIEKIEQFLPESYEE